MFFRVYPDVTIAANVFVYRGFGAKYTFLLIYCGRMILSRSFMRRSFLSFILCVMTGAAFSRVWCIAS